MNIFVLDENPRIAAHYHCDKHVVKMILESAQLLCSAHWINGNNTDEEPRYKLTHKNHPCSKWVRESIRNYNWLLRLSFSLLNEYEFRYNRIHKTTDVIEWANNNIPLLPDVDKTPFVQCIPDEYKSGDVVKSYREYYIGEKSYFAKWGYTGIPQWFKPTNVK